MITTNFLFEAGISDVGRGIIVVHVLHGASTYCHVLS